jgi:hypothetical protein
VAERPKKAAPQIIEEANRRSRVFWIFKVNSSSDRVHVGTGQLPTKNESQTPRRNARLPWSYLSPQEVVNVDMEFAKVMWPTCLEMDTKSKVIALGYIIVEFACILTRLG